MTGKEPFFKEHWEYFVLLACLAVLGGAVYFNLSALTTSAEDVTDDCLQEIRRAKPANEKVPPADTSLLQSAFNMVRNPPALAETDPKEASFLGSERRIFCRAGDGQDPKKACGRPIPADSETCPFCTIPQPPLVKIEVDTDHDGLPNEWEEQYGFNSNDPKDASADSDGDGFTNLEEFEAKTDPKDPKSHPDYLDYTAVAGPFKQTFLPFFFYQAAAINGGKSHRVTFIRLNAKSKYDNKFFVKVGDPIRSEDGKVDSGYMLEKYEHKTEERKMKGSNMKRKFDASTVTVVRKADGKKLVLRIGDRRIPVETEAVLEYSREGGKQFTVRAGSEFSIHDVKYRVKSLETKDGKSAVTLEDLAAKTQKILYGT